MAIRNKPTPADHDPEYRRLRRKADQEWEMAGLARQDRDSRAEAQHTAQAREYNRQAAARYREVVG